MPSEPTYDPWAWIIWGREIVEWDLVTTSGPSWKPLPIFFTVPFALLGDDLAPVAWLVVARAGGLFAIVMAYRLGARLAGPVAGAIAAGGLALSDEFVRHFARANSEGILVALGLWAVERHLAGRRRSTFALLFAAALLRPEVWPFFGLYGLWLGWHDREMRAWVGGAYVATAVLWFVPEYIGSGNFLRAASRALELNPGSAGEADVPFLEVARRASGMLMVPILAAAVGALAAAIWRVRTGRRRDLDVLLFALAAAAIIVVIEVGLMAQGGFSGNLRYVSLVAGGVCVMAGVGVVLAGDWLRRRFGVGAVVAGAVLAIAASVPFLDDDLAEFTDQMRSVRSEAAFYGELDEAIARSGGPGPTNRCGVIITGPYETQALAWRLHRHGDDIELDGSPPGTIIAARGSRPARDERFPRVVRTERWTVRRTCSP